MLLFFLMATLFLTSCNMNDDESKNQPNPDKEVTGTLGEDPDASVTNLQAPWVDSEEWGHNVCVRADWNNRRMGQG